MKLRTDLAFQVPDLRGVVATAVPKPSQELRTAYFDSLDLRLWQRGLSLRHRQGERPGGGTWTIKAPAVTGCADRTRGILDRTELSWSGERHCVPKEATRLLRGILGRAPLEQVTELATTRRRLVLRDGAGTSCGELDDDTVTVIGGRRHGLRFRQLEVEIDPGGEAILEAVLRELRRAGARLGDDPKLATALGRSAGPPATPRGHRGPATLGAVVSAAISTALEALLAHDLLLRLDPSDPPPHSVHQARVATRRLRSDLKTVGPALDPVWLEDTRAELRWLGAVLGQVRDADVLAGHLAVDDQGVPADDGGRAELQSLLDQQRRTAARLLAKVLESDRYVDVLDRLRAATVDVPFAATGSSRFGAGDRAARALPPLVRRQWRVLRRRVRQAGRHPTDRQLHRIRIGAKQVRYAAEMAEPVIGGPARRTARAAEKLQTVLGRHHDAVTAEQWLRAAATTPETSFVAGRLSAGQSRRQRELRRRWTTTWERLATKGMRRWWR